MAPIIVPEPTAPVPSLATRARSTLFDALFKDLAQPGSRLVHPNGESFTLKRAIGEGAVHSNRNLQVPLPRGGTVAHLADIAIELEGGKVLHVDVVDAAASLDHLKADAYDTIHFKRGKAPHHALLVFVRSVRSMIRQDAVEWLAHPYDYTFGVNEEDVVFEGKFAALRTEIARRLTAA